MMAFTNAALSGEREEERGPELAASAGALVAERWATGGVYG